MNDESKWAKCDRCVKKLKKNNFIFILDRVRLNLPIDLKVKDYPSKVWRGNDDGGHSRGYDLLLLYFWRPQYLGT
jgi:hypothetical protein